MSRQVGFILSVAVATAVLAFAVATDAQESGPTGQQILETRCQGCHDLRPIQTAAKDADMWRKTIDAMIDNGSDISAREIPVLVTHLTREHGPVPDGPGKDILLHTCTMCHDLQRIKNGRRSAEEWNETLLSMLNEGAPLSDEQFPVILNYLAKNFGVD